MHYASRRTTFRSASFKTYFEGKFVQTHNASCARPDFWRITRRTTNVCPSWLRRIMRLLVQKRPIFSYHILLRWDSLLRLFYDTYRDISPRWYHPIPFLLSHHSKKLSCLVCFVCCYFPGATINLYKKRCTGLAVVKGSNPVQVFFFFFRLSFRNCKSCVYNYDDLLSYNSFTPQFTYFRTFITSKVSYLRSNV